MGKIIWGAVLSVALCFFGSSSAMAEEANSLPVGTPSVTPSSSVSISRIGVFGPIVLSGTNKTVTLGNIKNQRPIGVEGPLAAYTGAAANSSDVLVIGNITDSSSDLEAKAGADGARGPAGVAGVAGPIGKTGKAGQAGASAFQVWQLATGRTQATLAEYLEDIKGPEGPIGPSGLITTGGGGGGKFTMTGVTNGCSATQTSTVTADGDGVKVACVDIEGLVSGVTGACDPTQMSSSVSFAGGQIKTECRKVSDLITASVSETTQDSTAGNCGPGQYASALSANDVTGKIAVVCRDVKAITQHADGTFSGASVPKGVLGTAAFRAAALSQSSGTSTSGTFTKATANSDCYETEMFGSLAIDPINGSIVAKCTASVYASKKFSATDSVRDFTANSISESERSCEAGINSLSMGEDNRMVVGCADVQALAKKLVSRVFGVQSLSCNAGLTNINKVMVGVSLAYDDSGNAQLTATCVNINSLRTQPGDDSDDDEDVSDGVRDDNSQGNCNKDDNGVIQPNPDQTCENNSGNNGEADNSQNGNQESDGEDSDSENSDDEESDGDDGDGQVGLQGLQGLKGDKGEKGDNGAPGLNGLSASAEWLALPSNRTKKLEDFYAYLASFISVDETSGPQGPMGPRGLAGASAHQVWVDSLPSSYRGGTAVSDFLAAIKGEKGDTGAAGAKGEKGDTGAAGAKGEQGDTGATGPAGPSGTSGFTETKVCFDNSTKVLYMTTCKLAGLTTTGQSPTGTEKTLLLK